LSPYAFIRVDVPGWIWWSCILVALFLSASAIYSWLNPARTRSGGGAQTQRTNDPTARLLGFAGLAISVLALSLQYKEYLDAQRPDITLTSFADYWSPTTCADARLIVANEDTTGVSLASPSLHIASANETWSVTMRLIEPPPAELELNPGAFDGPFFLPSGRFAEFNIQISVVDAESVPRGSKHLHAWIDIQDFAHHTWSTVPADVADALKLLQSGCVPNKTGPDATSPNHP
jgi:hypothetical protein